MDQTALPRRRLFAAGRIPARRTSSGTVLVLVTETPTTPQPVAMPQEAA